MSTTARYVPAGFSRTHPRARPISFFARYWHGAVSLPTSVWTSASLALACIVLGIANQVLWIEDWPQIAVFTTKIAVPALLMGAVAWSIVGTWHAARRQANGTGDRFWVFLSNCSGGLAALAIVLVLYEMSVPQLKEYWAVATHGPSRAELTADGRALLLTGRLGLGTAGEVRRILNRAPGVKTLVLESSGGLLNEAAKLRQLVGDHALNTHVETLCESACTLVFLAGVDRTAGPEARLGFHRPTFKGGPEQQARGTEFVLQLYQKAGVSPAFLARIAKTPPASVWHPTHDELIEDRVITRVLRHADARPASPLRYRARVDLEESIRTSAQYQILEGHFPGAMEQTIEAGWQARTRGGSDAEVASAMQRVGSALYAKLLLRVDDALLAEYLELLRDQLQAARAQSAQVCSRFIRGQVDVEQVLPPDLMSREQSWVRRTMGAANGAGPAQTDEVRFKGVLSRVFGRMAPEFVAVIATPSAYLSQPALHCDAHVALYDALSQEPIESRALAFRGILQNK